MMKRKFREISLLLAPVVALAAIVPGARFINNWRDKRELKTPTRPRIEACYLCAPIAWEAYNGAKVGYTVRRVVPNANAPFWMDHLQISNAQGSIWALLDGNYEYAKNALSESRGHVLDKSWFSTPKWRAYISEHRMDILGKEKPH